jgi:hypothetical protein
MRGAGNRHPWPSRKRRERGAFDVAVRSVSPCFFEAEQSGTLRLRALNVER